MPTFLVIHIVKRYSPYLTVLPLMLFMALQLPAESVSQDKIPTYSPRIINTYRHDTDSSTQGLIIADEVFYESTGLGTSSLLRVELQSGKILLRHDLPDKLFGEGLTLFNNKLYQLTWKAGKVFVYDREHFNLLHEFSIPTEGWGLTNDGKRLIMSDGTSVLRFMDPDTFQKVSQLAVKDEKGPVKNINELEYIHGLILANIYLTNEIVMIDSETGKVVGRIDLQNLVELIRKQGINTHANGIAYDQVNDRLYLTGKGWSLLFEVELVDTDSGITYQWQ